MAIARKGFGGLPSAETAELFTLTNAKGYAAKVSNYGGIITALSVPDRTGKVADVVLGYATLAGYLKDSPYFGAIIGRYGNRIGNARFALDGKEYRLAANNGPNHLHGGLVGFDKLLWTPSIYESPEGPVLELTCISPDGQEGYPGELSVKVTYTWTNANVLRVEYQAATDKPTVVNLTQHSYFNLAGAGKGDVLGHETQIFADRFTPVDAGLIPTGELRAVKGTPLDFTTPHAIGERIEAKDEQMRLGGGYDHNFVLPPGEGKLIRAARVHEPTSGRTMEVWTTEPGMQFYNGNFLDGRHVGKGGKPYLKRYGFCLETQHFPDSPNKPDFPPTTLRPGQTLRSTTEYRFLTR